jgi:hypothetical protein
MGRGHPPRECKLPLPKGVRSWEPRIIPLSLVVAARATEHKLVVQELPRRRKAHCIWLSFACCFAWIYRVERAEEHTEYQRQSRHSPIDLAGGSHGCSSWAFYRSTQLVRQPSWDINLVDAVCSLQFRCRLFLFAVTLDVKGDDPQ